MSGRTTHEVTINERIDAALQHIEEIRTSLDDIEGDLENPEPRSRLEAWEAYYENVGVKGPVAKAESVLHTAMDSLHNFYGEMGHCFYEDPSDEE